MAKYATTEQEYYCNNCDRYCTEKQMWWPAENFYGRCPGCKESVWARYMRINNCSPNDRVVFDIEMVPQRYYVADWDKHEAL